MILFIYFLNLGGWHALAIVSLADLLGIENLAKSYGLAQFVMGIAYLSSTPLHGKKLHLCYC